MEKRKAKRFPKRVNVRFGEKDITRTGITNDISSTGLFVISSYLPPIDSRLHLQLMLPGDRSIFMEGVVRRHRLSSPQLRQIERGGFGVSFLTPAELVNELVPRSESANRFVISFFDVAQLQQAFDQEIRHGGIFLRTEAQLARDTRVVVEISLEFAARQFAFPATVMQTMTATTKGLAVTFDDKQQVQQALQAFLTGAQTAGG